MDLHASPAPHGAVRALALVVDSETDLRIETADRLAAAGFEVLEAWSAPTAILQIERHAGLRLVIADIGRSGLQDRFAFLREISLRWPDLSVIALSAGPSPDDLPDGVGFAQKPLTPALAREAWQRLAA